MYVNISTVLSHHDASSPFNNRYYTCLRQQQESSFIHKLFIQMSFFFDKQSNLFTINAGKTK